MLPYWKVLTSLGSWQEGIERSGIIWFIEVVNHPLIWEQGKVNGVKGSRRNFWGYFSDISNPHLKATFGPKMLRPLYKQRFVHKWGVYIVSYSPLCKKWARRHLPDVLSDTSEPERLEVDLQPDRCPGGPWPSKGPVFDPDRSFGPDKHVCVPFCFHPLPAQAPGEEVFMRHSLLVFG